MNKERRRQISVVHDKLDSLKCEIEQLRDEEQDSFNNLPENLQATDRGQQMENACDALQDAATSVEEAMTLLDTAGE